MAVKNAGVRAKTARKAIVRTANAAIVNVPPARKTADADAERSPSHKGGGVGVLTPPERVDPDLARAVTHAHIEVIVHQDIAQIDRLAQFLKQLPQL